MLIVRKTLPLADRIWNNKYYYCIIANFPGRDHIYEEEEENILLLLYAYCSSMYYFYHHILLRIHLLSVKDHHFSFEMMVMLY